MEGNYNNNKGKQISPRTAAVEVATLNDLEVILSSNNYFLTSLYKWISKCRK